MSAYADYPADATVTRRGNWFTRAEDWLDAKGRGAWIAVMILGFIFFWPVGLALLAYMIWSKRMFKGCAQSRHAARCGHHSHHSAMRRMGGQTGNSAFDAYKADTLARLEREQDEFETFLARLRASRDKAEFDQYMADRARAAAEEADGTDDEPSKPEADGSRGSY